MIDCTDPKLVAKAVIHAPGRPIINSINLENEERFAGMAEIMAKYGVPAVAMCIGTKVWHGHLPTKQKLQRNYSNTVKNGTCARSSTYLTY